MLGVSKIKHLFFTETLFQENLVNQEFLDQINAIFCETFRSHINLFLKEEEDNDWTMAVWGEI